MVYGYKVAMLRDATELAKVRSALPRRIGFGVKT